MLKYLLKKEVLLKIKLNNEMKVDEHYIKEFEELNLKFMYPCIYKEGITDDKKKEMLIFLNNNYKGDKFVSNYSYELFDYCIQKSIVIELRDHLKIIGLLVGCKMVLSVNGESKEFVEAKFMCLDKTNQESDFISIVCSNFKKNIKKYMINLLKKECINQGIYYGYCINNSNRGGEFCKKKIYYRPLNVEKLVCMKMLYFTSELNKELYKKVYNTFNYVYDYEMGKSIKYDCKYIDTIELSEKLIKYYRNKYDIYDYSLLSVDSLKRILDSDCFNNFVVYDEYNEIISYMCVYKVEKTKDILKSYKDGCVYLLFLDNDEEINSFLEIVFKYMYDNKVFDRITICDTFKINYKNSKFVRDGDLNYYIYENDGLKMYSRDNGLISI